MYTRSNRTEDERATVEEIRQNLGVRNNRIVKEQHKTHLRRTAPRVFFFLLSNGLHETTGRRRISWRVKSVKTARKGRRIIIVRLEAR